MVVQILRKSPYFLTRMFKLQQKVIESQNQRLIENWFIAYNITKARKCFAVLPSGGRVITVTDTLRFTSYTCQLSSIRTRNIFCVNASNPKNVTRQLSYLQLIILAKEHFKMYIKFGPGCLILLFNCQPDKCRVTCIILPDLIMSLKILSRA